VQHINIHKDFKLNGKTFGTSNALIHYVENNLTEHSRFVKEIFNDQNFIIAHTSGSTGTPKEIKILKKYLINSAKNTIDYFNLVPKTTALLNLSSDFIAGKMMWVRALIGGWYLDVISPENKAIAKQLQNKKYDFGAMVPLQAYENIGYLNHISQLIIGGGSVSDELLQKLQKLSNKCFATYGMTETVTHIAVKLLNGSDANNSYQVLKDIKIDIDSRNCLIIDAPKLSDKKVITNDLVTLVDNNHFVWLGRFDNIINSGGVKIIPEQVEKKLSGIINTPFFISSFPDQKLGEKLVIFIEGKEKPISFENLNRFEKPKQVIFIEQFDRTNSGKIIRKQIQTNYLKSLE